MFQSRSLGSVIHSACKTARAHYVADQEALRRDIEERRLEKEGARLISQMLYGVPPICKPGHTESCMPALTLCSESSDPRGLLDG